MVESGFKKDLALAFLDRVRQELLGRYTAEFLGRASAHSLLEFRETLKELTSSFNANYADKSLQALNRVLALEGMVVESFTKLTERSSQLDEVRDKVALLSENSTMLKKNAVTLRQRSERQNLLSMAVLAGGLLVSLPVPGLHYCCDRLRLEFEQVHEQVRVMLLFGFGL